jgi:hypothetical protein
LYDNPRLADAWSRVDADLKAKFEALLFDDSPKAASASSTGAQKPTASTITSQMIASSQMASSISSAKPKEQQALEQRVHELEIIVKKMNSTGTSLGNTTIHGDCGFGELTSKTWQESGANTALKEELDLWRKKNDSQAFHAHLYKTYAPSLARSAGHCNGRGFCSVCATSCQFFLCLFNADMMQPISCEYVDSNLPTEKRKKMFFVMEAIAHLSRVTMEENDVLKHTLALLSSQTVNIVRDYTSKVQHEQIKEKQKAYDAEQAKK